MRQSRTLEICALALGGTLYAASATAQVVVNELEYDEPGVDTGEYIELANLGASDASLEGYTLSLIDGGSGSEREYRSIALPAVTLAPGALFVVCADAGALTHCDLDGTPDTNLIQNGPADAVALFAGGVLQDRLDYEGSLTDDASGARGLSRCEGAFAVRPNTPGLANDCGGAIVLGACADAATPIAQVQGAALTSPLLGQTVVIEGVVVGDFRATSLQGVFVQAADSEQDGDPATSDGVFVFLGTRAVEIGDGGRIRVAGVVSESSGSTEISSISAALACPAGAHASAQLLTFPVANVADLERYEGMAILIAQPLTVTGNFELGRYGSLDLSVGGRLFQPTQVATPGAAAIAQQALNDRSRIVLDDAAGEQNPNPIPYKDAAQTRRVGDTLPQLTGVLDDRFGAYRVQPTQAVVFSSDNPRPSSPEPVGGRLRVASLNVLNYFTTLDTGGTDCGPNGGLECRGANTAAERERQRAKLLQALLGLNADVVGLLEIQNDAGATVNDLLAALNARLPTPEYAAIDTGVIGTDAIKLALLYKTAAVVPVGSFALLTSAVDPRFLDTKNRPVLVQTFSELATGARFTVALNHWKSKGSACTDVSDPDTGDGQGNCNRTRTQAALALTDWLARDPTASGDSDVLLLGDLNAYAQEDPLTALASAGYVPLIARFVGTNGYSFQFSGQSGYLDHTLASASLAPQVTGVTEWHIDADEPTVLDYNTEFKTDDPFNPNDPFRTSDHDPLIVGLSLTAPGGGGSSLTCPPAYRTP